MDDQTARLVQLEVLSDSAKSLHLDCLGALDLDAHEAASQQIANQIRTAIVAGQLGAGEMLPSQTRLARHYGVARETAKAALTQLRNEGLVRSWQGKGTFVRGARTAGEQHLRSELAEIQEKVRRLQRGLVTLEGALADLISTLSEDGRQAASEPGNEGRRR